MIYEIMYAGHSSLFGVVVCVCLAVTGIFVVLYGNHKCSKKTLWAAVGIAMTAAISCTAGISSTGMYSRIMRDAEMYELQGDYISAYNTYQTVPYGKAKDKLKEIYKPYQYQCAMEHWKIGNQVGALEIFIEIIDYCDSKENIIKIANNIAESREVYY